MNRSGFALISTLLILAVLTIMAIGFLTAIQNERLTSRSFVSSVVSQQIAESALLIAQERLRLLTESDLAYVVGLLPSDDPAFSPLVCVVKGDGTTVPLVSSPTYGLPNSDPHTERLGSDSVDLNTSAGLIQPRTQIPDPRYYRVPWEYIEDPTTNKRVGRFAYLLLDEQARLNPRYHLGNARTTQPSDWTNLINEIPVSGSSSALMTPEEATTLSSIKNALLTPHTIGQAFASQTRAKEAQIFYSTASPTNDEIIPQGYPDAGKPKYNLNELATNVTYGATATERAANIAAIIDRNLPQFKERDPSLPVADRLRYVQRLAASIVDYIDTDTESTHLADGEPAGRDLFPLVAAVAENYQRTAKTATSTTFRNQAFVQLWNPYNQPVTGEAEVRLYNRMRLSFPNGLKSPFQDYEPAPVSVAIRPNEFVVVEFEDKNQTWTRPGPPGSGSDEPLFEAGSPSNSEDQTTHPYFEFYWNGQLIDLSRRPPVGPGQADAGMVRNPRTFNNGSNTWQASFVPTQTNSFPLRFVGDPRASYLSNYEWATVSADTTYRTETHWKGRQAPAAAGSDRRQNFELSWRARDYISTNPRVGTIPGSINTKPSGVAAVYDASAQQESDAVPFYFRNAPMISIGELGNVFDPAQADDNGTAPLGGSPASPYVAGGGRTLRIGQPEFSYWDSEGKRASQLLDLFTTAPIDATAPEPVPQRSGLININTAPQEVLEAVFLGLGPFSDKTVTPPSKIEATQATALARHLIDIRQAQIFRSVAAAFISLPDLTLTPNAENRTLLSKLCLETSYSPTLTIDAAVNNRTKVMDRGREEPFTRIVESLTVQSRAFRIYLIGQGLDARGNPLGTSRLEATLQLKRTYDPSTTPATPRIETTITYRQ